MPKRERIFSVKTTLTATELRAQLKKKDKEASVTSARKRVGSRDVRRKIKSVSIMV